MGLPLLRLRSDDQLVALFRDGHDDAFRAIHDRYHKRLLAYMRQMLPRRQDAEDALQEVFVRAYFGLRAHDRELSLRAWLFRVAHNRCIDELRRPTPPPPEIIDMVRPAVHDTAAEVDCRESLRRLIADVRRLPEQQRSALLMRELGGMPYADLAKTLGVSVPAVKSLLVRARVGLARAAEARDTACSEIREELVCAHDNGVRPDAMARRHMRDCTGCRSFRRELRGMSRELAALAPTLGPLGFLAKLLGGSSGAGGGTAAAGSAVGAGGTASSAGLVVGANHVAALLAAAVATGGAVAIQHTISAPSAPPHPAPAHQGSLAARSGAAAPAKGATVVIYAPNGAAVTVPASDAAPATAPKPPASPATAARHSHASSSAGLTSAVSNGSTSAAQSVGSSDSTLAGGSTETSQPAASSDQSSTSPTSGTSTGTSLLSSSGSTGTLPGSGSSQPAGGSTASGSSSTGSGSTGSSGSSSGTSGTSSGSSGSSSGSTSGSGPTASTSSAGSTGSSSSSTSGSGTSGSGAGSGTSSGTGSTATK